MTLLWKKQVFLSPSNNQVILERCFYNFSSLSNHNCTSLWEILWSFILWPRGSMRCKYSSLVCTRQIFLLMEPKDSLFQTSNFKLHADILYITLLNPIGTEVDFHAFKIIWQHSFESIHMASKHKNFFRLLLCSGPIDKEIGKWCEYVAPRWEANHYGIWVFHSLFATKRSNLSHIRNSPSLPLHRVKLLPSKPRSCKWQ